MSDASTPARPPLAAGDAVIGLVLAAGAGRRFGSPKQLALYQGRPLLEHALLAMAGARLLDGVVVVLGAHAEEVLASVERHGAAAVICADWEEGQAASLRTGVAAVAGRADAVVVTLGDQPAIDARAIDRVIGGARALEPGRARQLSAGARATRCCSSASCSSRSRRCAAMPARGRFWRARARAPRSMPCDDFGSDLDIDTVEELRLSAGGSTQRS